MNEPKRGRMMLRSKDVAEMLDISISTIRYYEKIGIIPPIERNANGYRIYTNSTLNWIYLMKSLRNAGVSIESLLEFSRLSQVEGPERNKQKQVLEDQLNEIEEKITEMQRVRNLLSYKIETYDDHIAKFQSGELTSETAEELWKVKF
ncbi:MerR family transcriptional regulator [Tetragenococcus koreensis]|uniref:MerR family transcriptional regulator n=2 Tax=Tetragenococcus koreensis TaxID=290335 RepID=UPI001F165820|nr:MerR family transcriptional regulator [Tetragenococcus koreensis]MCF1618008.1 MerR family transcriptional regulator [Tetragenococcus koreensis]MCF1628314.1 MerR family transcriptional regulator [Tetragenococcus koreensis]MDN6165856.1 MerR family transcriptional regulator [Tetragenococcus koreensis]MDN6289001.1 MerR family transcriptional regulator [Tetragenococcus koreensis]MDN6344074.1 MerR family transcriptional regulator [Tetragenococcus koreensis]